jgi:hypothetical protein
MCYARSFRSRLVGHSFLRRSHLAVEPLDDRRVLSSFTWTGAEDDVWSNSDNWDPADYDVPIEGGVDPFYPSADGLWDIATITNGARKRCQEPFSVPRPGVTVICMCSRASFAGPFMGLPRHRPVL